jgi:hypothetical protein
MTDDTASKLAGAIGQQYDLTPSAMLSIRDVIAVALFEAVKAERAACALVAESMLEGDVAAAIRARGGPAP